MTEPTDKVTAKQILELAGAIESDPWYYFGDCPSIGEDGDMKAVASALIARLSEHDALKDQLATARGYLNNPDVYAERDTLKAEVENLRLQLKYPDPEDMPGELAAKYCPFKDQLHFHHDGCPSEWAVEERAEKAEAALAEARPLLEAVEGATLLRCTKWGPKGEKIPGHVFDIPGEAAIRLAALAYRAAREKKEGERG